MTDNSRLQSKILGLEAEVARLSAAEASARARGDALAVSEERYRALFTRMDEGFCVIEFFDGPHGPLSDYIHIEANDAYARNAGIPNVVGQKVREMVPDEADGWVELYRNVLITGNPVRFERELVATGRTLELSAFRIEPASRKHVAVLFQDITLRKKAEAALNRSKETLEARIASALAERRLLADLVEGANAGVIVADKAYRLIAINGAATAQFKSMYGRQPQIGVSLLDLLDARPDDLSKVRTLWARALGGEEFIEISPYKDAHGTRYFEMRFSTLRSEAGEQIGAYLFVYDVTERVQEQQRLRVTEDALRQSQKMEAVGQLTGGIAHDFNNMLAVVIGSLRLAQRRFGKGDLDIAKYLDSALNGAERGAKLVSRLLAFSRQQPLAPERTDPNQLISGMEDVLRRSIPESIRIELVHAGGLWRVFIDAPGLESALVNLAVNARDAMPDGGKLTIETANAYLDDPYAASHADVTAGQYVLIAVTDTGHGMDAETIARAFEPFFTTKSVGMGTGLGLSQVYGFVKQSGGHVKIYSEPGVGTTVKLYLPRLVEQVVTSPLPVRSHAPAPSGSGQIILVVEDDDDVRALSFDILTELGYAVLPANGAAQALRLLDQNPGIVLLLTDVVMPDMNGKQLSEEALRRRPDLKVLFTTGYTRNAIIHNGMLDEGVELIVKPFTLEDLAAKVSKVLGNAS